MVIPTAPSRPITTSTLCCRIIRSSRAALADLDAGRKLDPLVKSAEAGAAEVLYGLGAVGSQANDDLASMIYLRLALYLAPDNGLALVTLADRRGDAPATGFDPAAMRQAIAAAMSRSKREIPHYYLSQTVEVSAALAAHRTIKSRAAAARTP